METETINSGRQTFPETGQGRRVARGALRLVRVVVAMALGLSSAVAFAQNFPNSLSNTATVTAPANIIDTGNKTATDTNTLALSSDLKLVKTVTSATPAPAGSTVTYKLVVSNAGPSDAVGATITDTVPGQLTNVSWTCVASGTSACGAASGTGNVNLTATVAAGGAANEVTITVSGTAPASGTIAANTATVTVPTGSTDPNPGDNTSTTPTIPVTAVIVANPDSGSAPTTGGVAVANVLSNDTVGGAGATLANVNLTQVSTTNPGVTLNATTGAVDVAAATPAGSYTVTYQICEKASPANCATAPVTVTVTNAQSDLSLVKTVTSAIPAQAGSTVTYRLVISNAGPAIATGATIVDAVPVQLTNVSWTCMAAGTSTCGAANGTGNVNVTANVGVGVANNVTVTVSGTAPASGTIAANTATVTGPPGSTDPNPGDNAGTTPTIPVTMVIAAVNDTAGPISGNGANDVVNVLANDTLGGVGVNLTEVIFTPISQGPLTIDSNGNVDVAPNTPTGTYNASYQICERANPANCSGATVTVNVVAAPVVLRMTMTAAQRTARIGDLVRYTVRIDNVGQVDARQETLVGQLPAGFEMVPKSLTVADDDGVGSLQGTRPLRIAALDIAIGRSATLTYALRVGAGVRVGVYTNRGTMNDASGAAISNEATADVEIIGDPMLDDSLIVGSVFNDANGNGRQDPGERGLPGVRLGTVEGILAETDRYGRFHIVGIDGGQWSRGRNFLVKVDTATLPAGSRFTTENPRVLRVTPGVPVRFDFGVQVPGTPVGGGKTEVDIDLGEVFFNGYSAVVPAEHLPVLDRIVGRLREAGGGSVAITANADNMVLAFQRAEAVRKGMDDRLSPELRKATRIELRAQVDGGQTLVTLGQDIDLGVLLFDDDKATIRPQYLPLLAAIAKRIDALPDVVVAISGYADMRGTDEHNMRLSQRRADAVANEIAAHLTGSAKQCLRVEPRPMGQAATCPGAR
ncbi:OmpA family protein [Solilutibacter silvestris]|uniref:OmpA family protein n=1 Tax=Solilutibacter silvestris TaxID=1645665 RepID=UPI003D34C6AB